MKHSNKSFILSMAIIMGGSGWTWRNQKFNFVSEPDDALKCLICLEVAKEPRQHEKCGRLFCKKCLYEYGKVKPCPSCRDVQPQYFMDARGMSYTFSGMLIAVSV